MSKSEKKRTGNPILVIIILAVIILGAVSLLNNFTNKPEYFATEDGDFSSYTTEERDNWELSLYSSENPDTDYLIDNIKGFASREACISEGVSRRQSGGSFECSYKCKTQYTTIQGVKDEYVICEKVCDEAGCRD